MKSLRFLLCALVATGVAACSDDGPGTNAPTEGYLRAFVKEFGVPAEGHDFSMARTAGLTVKASRTTHILVTALYEDEEYLFGDLNVGAGVSRVPVTIPSDITSLYVSIGKRKYEVAADGLIDLDNLPSPVQDPQSRTVIVDPLQGNGIGRIWETTNPVIAFRYDEWLKDYFEKFPIGEDNPAIGLSDREISGWSGVAQPWGDTGFGSPQVGEEIEFYVFPIFWKKNPDLSKTFYVRINSAFDQLQAAEMTLPFNGSTNIPFPKLGYSKWITNKNSINWKTFNNFTFDQGSLSQAFPTDGTNLMIVSEGCVLDFERSMGLQACLRVEWMTSTPQSSSSNPRHNAEVWNGNYFKSTIDGLADAVSSTRRYTLKDGVDFSIYEDGKLSSFSTDIAFLLAFNAPPTQPNDPLIRDYSEVILLVIPKSDVKLEYKISSEYQKFSWTVAAEDLGGSFDWDFNDAVFSFTDVIETLPSVNEYNYRTLEYGGLTDAVAVRSIEVEPLAAGGTMPLYITYTGRLVSTPELPSSGEADYYTVNEAIRAHMAAPAHEGTYVIGTEIHKWLGASTHTRQLNTNAKVEIPTGRKIKFSIPYNDDPENFSFTLSNEMSAKNQPMHGFAVLVDRENKLNIDAREGDGFEALPTYNLGEGSYLIGRPDENEDNVAPQMIMVTDTKNNWEWPQECVNIKDAYPNFSGWVSGYSSTSYKNWHTSNKINDKVTKR